VHYLIFLKQNKKQLLRKKKKREKKKFGVRLWGLNAMPFRTEAGKYNHWATGGLLELDSKFYATYMHIKRNFYCQANLALENVL